MQRQSRPTSVLHNGLAEWNVYRQSRRIEQNGAAAITNIETEERDSLRQYRIEQNLIQQRQDRLQARKTEIRSSRLTNKEEHKKYKKSLQVSIQETIWKSKQDRKTRQRSVTISLPVRHADHRDIDHMTTTERMHPLKGGHDINAGKLPGLTNENDMECVDDFSGRIPEAVVNRGRRMSRSVSNMSELIKMEISDYVDKNHEALPNLSPKQSFGDCTRPSTLKLVQKPNLNRAVTELFDSPSKKTLSLEIRSTAAMRNRAESESHPSNLLTPTAPASPRGLEPHPPMMSSPRNSLSQRSSLALRRHRLASATQPLNSVSTI